MVEPRTRVGKAFRFQPPQVTNRSFQANGWRVELSDRRKAIVFADDAEHSELTVVVDRHVDLLALSPETEQRPLPA